MRYRKQTQHIRRYRSGKWTCVNRGIRYYRAGDVITGPCRCPYCGKNKKRINVISRFNKYRYACDECKGKMNLN